MSSAPRHRQSEAVNPAATARRKYSKQRELPGQRDNREDADTGEQLFP